MGGETLALSKPADIAWPEDKTMITVQATKGATCKMQVAAGEQLFVWARDMSSRREFEGVCTASECKSLCEMLGPMELAALLIDALQGELQEEPEKKPEASASMDIVAGCLGIRVSWEPKYFKKHFALKVPEKSTSQADRLEARLDEAEDRLDHLEKAACQVLSTWKLHVVNPRNAPEHEGSDGCFASVGPYFLLQDTDFKAKKTGVATRFRATGWIQATFERPVHVRSIKIAPFPVTFGGGLADSEVLVQQLTLEKGQWETIRTLPGGSEEELEISVNARSVAWRLSGDFVCISKFIFYGVGDDAPALPNL